MVPEHLGGGINMRSCGVKLYSVPRPMGTPSLGGGIQAWERLVRGVSPPMAPLT